jgi:hypothetical protein
VTVSAREFAMAKVFSVVSRNVERFSGDASRLGRIVQFLDDQNPDVFGLYEVESALRGWITEPTPAKQDLWLDKYLDRSLGYFEVHE